MPDMIQYIALPIVGFLVGLLIISLGGGGGAVYVGILTAFFNIPPAIAASTSLATMIPTTAVGTFSHWKAGNVNFRFGLTMMIGGVAGSIAGSLCSGLLPQILYNKLTGIILLLLAVQMLVSYMKKKRKRNDTEDINQAKKADTIKAVCFGLFGGAMSGRSWIKAGLLVLGCLGANLAQAALYVYELPDGSRVVTDHALNGRYYRLIRVGETAKNIGKLAAHQDPQLFRADPSTYDRL